MCIYGITKITYSKIIISSNNLSNLSRNYKAAVTAAAATAAAATTFAATAKVNVRTTRILAIAITTFKLLRVAF